MDQEKHAGYVVHTLAKTVGRHLEMLFEQQNLSKMQSWIIRYLYERPEENIYQKDIEAFFHIARSTVTEVLQGMEKQGFITRCSVESDARLKRLVLTEKGVETQMAAFRILNENERILRQNISEEELETFFRVAKHMEENISQSLSAPAPSEE